MPTEAEDLAAATAALQGVVGKSDPDEAKSFVAMYRALEDTRPATTAVNSPLLLAVGLPSDPLSPADREMLEQMRGKIDTLLAAPPAS